MSYSVYDAVCEILDGTSYLKAAFEYDLVNHAALARFLKPRVIEKTGDIEVSTEAIIGSIRRYLRHYVPTKPSRNLIELIESTRIDVKTGYEEIHFSYSPKTCKNLVELQNKIKWAAGEKMLVIARPEQILVLIQEQYAEQLTKVIDKKDILRHEKNKAIVVLSYNPKHFYKGIGGINFYTWHFATNEVSIEQIFSTYDKTTIVVNEKDATKIYQKLTEAFKNFAILHDKQLHEKKQLTET